MSTLITILHVIVCLFLMLTVLLQSGKGGGMGGAFGGSKLRDGVRRIGRENRSSSG